MDRLSDFRAVFAEVVAARGACGDPRIKAAFARVPRHEFVEPGPWRFAEDGPPTASTDPALLYQDLAVGLAPDRGIPTGLPSLHARCLDACAPKPGENVVHVGAGAGYFTAIIAELVGPTGTVRAFEVDAALAAMAERNLAPWPRVTVEARSGTVAEGPVDLIYVCAGVQQNPGRLATCPAPRWPPRGTAHAEQRRGGSAPGRERRPSALRGSLPHPRPLRPLHRCDGPDRGEGARGRVCARRQRVGALTPGGSGVSRCVMLVRG